MVYLQSKNAYVQAIIKTKHESWHKFINENSQDNIWKTLEVYRNKGSHGRRLMSTSATQGTKTWDEAANHLLNHFFQKDVVTEDDMAQRLIRFEAQQPWNGDASRDIDPIEVENIIRTLRKKIAPGIDQVENEAMVTMADLISPSLAKAFNACKKHGVFPTQWKEARLIPVLKDNNRGRGVASSYRPICLLSVIGKIFEKLMKDRILERVEISPFQYGFRKGKCTTDAVEKVINEAKMAQEKMVVIIMVDIESAFNSLWWPHILVRLR